MSNKKKTRSAVVAELDDLPSSASGKKLRAQGHRTRELIIREAKQLLLEGGSLTFALRTAARRSNVSISNLQYYFPTRASLLRAIVEPIVEKYRAKVGAGLGNPVTAKETLFALLDQNLSDVRDPEVSAIWMHFTSLAMTDPESARILDAAHAMFTSDFSRLIRTIHPSMGTRDSQILARITTSLVDGLVFQINAGHRKSKLTSAIDVRVREIVEWLIMEYPLRTS